MLGLPKQLQRLFSTLLPFRPNTPELYLVAFSHGSVCGPDSPLAGHSNERLEFLGDAVIELIVSRYLVERFPALKEGRLTQLRARLVSRESLDRLAEAIGLGDYIISSPYASMNAKHMAGNALEALWGAIYLDQGYDTAQALFVELLLETHIQWDVLLENPVDYKSQLLIWSQQHLADVHIATHCVHPTSHRFRATIIVDGAERVSAFGASKKRAEQEAARLFLETSQPAS